MPMESRCRRYWQPNSHGRETETGSTHRIRLIGGLVLIGLVLLLSVALAPRRSRTAVIGAPIRADDYTFINFDPRLADGAAGSNVNGISNTSQTVGTLADVNNAFTFIDFSGAPGKTTQLNTGAGQIALEINSAGNVVGGNGATAFFLPDSELPVTPASPGGAMFGFVNDQGNIVGQILVAGSAAPGLILPDAAGTGFTTINAPSGPDIADAQGINNNGVVGSSHAGNDGPGHGFAANMPGTPGTTGGTAIAERVIPNAPGEPGATSVTSQTPGIDDNSLAAGYYGDSTAGQHGFLRNTKAGADTFLDHPSGQFHNGVEATQITGINNISAGTGVANPGEIAGLHTDAQGIAPSFVACPSSTACPGSVVSSVPEPSSLILMGLSCGVLGLIYFRRRRNPRVS